MAIRQINTAAYNYSMMLEAINKSYKGKADITISEYDSDAAPDVKVGSVWENNGAIFILESTDLAPTGYAGIANSTTFYCYYDESASVFIYSSTAPTWSDALQGWYNSNDRAFFSMYKDSGGTLYESKKLLKTPVAVEYSGGIQTDNVVLKTKIIEIGTWNMQGVPSVNIAHGLTFTKIRAIDVVVVVDTGTNIRNFLGSNSGTVTQYNGGYYTLDSTNIVLIHPSGSYFDGASYSSTASNRGWVTVQYEV